MNKLHYSLFSFVLLALSSQGLSAKDNQKKNVSNKAKPSAASAVRSLTKVENEHLAYRILRASSAHPYLDQIAQMRSKLYIGFPYLYASNIDPQQEDVSYYETSAGTIMVGAFDDNDIMVGFAIGLPLKDFTTSCNPEDEKVPAAEKFKAVGVAINTNFYVSEILVDSNHLNQGLESSLYNLLAEKVVATQSYDSISLMHMDRGENHPLKPAGFVDPELTILSSNGFNKTNHTVSYRWNTLQADGSAQMQDNAMDFWVKALNRKK